MRYVGALPETCKPLYSIEVICILNSDYKIYNIHNKKYDMVNGEAKSAIIREERVERLKEKEQKNKTEQINRRKNTIRP